MIRLLSWKHLEIKSKPKQNEINEIPEEDKDSINDDTFDELVAEIAAEIDYEYKDPKNCIDDDNISMNKVNL